MPTPHRSAVMRSVLIAGLSAAAFALCHPLAHCRAGEASAGAPRPLGKAALQELKKTYTYKQAGDCKIQADVFRLPGEGARPAILWIHGGALISGRRDMVGWDAVRVQLERYFSAGYVVVSIDYRLAPETKLAGIMEDLQDAWGWLREKGPALAQIDPERIAVVGHSAGGYLTLMAGCCLTPRPKALVAFYGYGDIVGPWYSRPDPHYLKQKAVAREDAYSAVGGAVLSEAVSPHRRGQFYLYCRQHGLWPKEVAGHDPDKEPEAFVRFCPMRQVSEKYPPTLLLHGDQDTDVPYQLSVDMDKELARHNVQHKFVSMPGFGHGFDGQIERDAKVRAAFDAVLAFLQEHVPAEKPAGTPPPQP